MSLSIIKFTYSQPLFDNFNPSTSLLTQFDGQNNDQGNFATTFLLIFSIILSNHVNQQFSYEINYKIVEILLKLF